jgi:hypothetical protein
MLLDLSDQPGRSCDEVHEIGARLLDAVDARMWRLAAVREELHRVVASCITKELTVCCRTLHVLTDHHDDPPTQVFSLTDVREAAWRKSPPAGHYCLYASLPVRRPRQRTSLLVVADDPLSPEPPRRARAGVTMPSDVTP